MAKFQCQGFGGYSVGKSFQIGDFNSGGTHAFVHSTKVPPSNQTPVTPVLSSKVIHPFIHSCHKYLLSVCCESWGLEPYGLRLSWGKTAQGRAKPCGTAYHLLSTLPPMSLAPSPHTVSPVVTEDHLSAPSRQVPKMGIMASTRDTDMKLVTAFSANIIPFY